MIKINHFNLIAVIIITESTSLWSF